MGLLAYIKGETSVGDTNPRATALAKEITALEGTIRQDWTRRVYGDGVYSGYQTLRDFYKGKQWSFRKEGGGTMRTYNYVFTIVENMTAFLTNEPPQISCPARNVTDPVERSLAEGRTKLLDAVHEDNALGLVFQRAVRTGSITGDAFIFGAIPTFKTNENGEKVFDRIRYWNIEKPEHIQVLWRDENFTEMDGFIKKYRISVESAKRLFAEELKDKKFHVQADYDAENPSSTQTTEVPMITIKEVWLNNEYLLMFNNDNKPVHYVKHDWGFIPLQYVPNIHLPGEPKGTSDIEHELDPQQEYNERASDLADIIKELARPSYWGKNLDNVSEVRSGQTVIYNVGDDAEINAMPRSGETFSTENYLADRKRDIIGLSGLNEVLYPSTQTVQATGRALSVIMSSVNNKISLRKEWWIRAFKELNKSILFHAEQHIPDAKLLINGYYKSDVFITSVLLRSVSDEINKFNSKIQSLTTTQKNVGIQSPTEEQKLMKEELEDSVLSVEISKQPGLLHQIIAERMAAAQQDMGEGGDVAGQPAPISNDNQGENPAAIRGVASPVSSEGAIRQAASKAGAVNQIKKK